MNIARYAFTTYTQNRHKKWPGQATATATATTGTATATAINRPSETTDVLPIAGALLSTMLYATLVEGAGGLMTKQRPPSGRDAPTDTLDTSVITTFPFFGNNERQHRQLEVIADKLETVVLDSTIPLDTRHIIDNWQREEDNTQWTTASRGIKRLITSRSILSAKDLIQHMGNNMPDFTRELKVRLSLGPEDVPADAILSSIILKMCTES